MTLAKAPAGLRSAKGCHAKDRLVKASTPLSETHSGIDKSHRSLEVLNRPSRSGGMFYAQKREVRLTGQHG